MAYVPIMVPMHHNVYSSNGPTKYIESTEEDHFININASSECDIYKGFNNKYWIRFKIAGSIKYYGKSFETRDEAMKQLLIFMDEK